MLKRYLFFVVIFILVLIFYSCNAKHPEGGGMPISPYIVLEIELVNNSDTWVDCEFKSISIGYLLIDNTTDMFESEELYLSLKDMDVEVDAKVNIDQSVDFSNDWHPLKMLYRNVYSETILFVIDKDKQEYGRITLFDFDVFGRDVRALNLNLSFGNGEKRVIAGYPKSYYNQPPDAVHYGLFYQFDYDIRGDQESPHYGDPVNGDMTPIPWYTLYSVRITINDPDNITVEVLPETGEELASFIPAD